MGLLDSLTGGGSDGFKNVADQLSPSSLIGENGAFSTGDAATVLLGGSVAGALGDALGLEQCPGGTSGSSSSSSANDACGKDNNPLAQAALGLGMALAGPAIAEAGSMIGGALDEGLNGTVGFLGDGITAGVGALGMSEENTSMVSDAIGVGAGSAIGGNNGEQSGANALASLGGAVADKNSEKTSSNYLSNVKSTLTQPGI